MNELLPRRPPFVSLVKPKVIVNPNHDLYPKPIQVVLVLKSMFPVNRFILRRHFMHVICGN